MCGQVNRNSSSKKIRRLSKGFRSSKKTTNIYISCVVIIYGWKHVLFSVDVENETCDCHLLEEALNRLGNVVKTLATESNRIRAFSAPVRLRYGNTRTGYTTPLPQVVCQTRDRPESVNSVKSIYPASRIRIYANSVLGLRFFFF